jgi:hypothetical protein
MHELWTTHNWQNATEEQIIAALFNAPPFICPEDMGAIKRFNPQAIRKYQVLFYQVKFRVTQATRSSVDKQKALPLPRRKSSAL